MDKTRIQEIIVIEGRDGTRKLREVVDADTIETIRSAINEEVLMQIGHAQEIREVIIFTDPDFSEEKIRKIIMEAVPRTKHAFLPRTQTKPKKKGGLGVEHVSDAATLEALEKIMAPDISQTAVSEITRRGLLDYGLIARVQAEERREKLGDELRIGYTNDRQLEKRLKMFRITLKEPAQVMKIVEEQHE